MALFAIPVNHPRHHRAIEVARECLRAGIEIRDKHFASNNIYSWAVYCHWMLLHAPVTPFMGIFGHIVADPGTSENDLALLEDFAESLRPAAHLSDGISKFHQLCAVFVQVARAYLQANKQRKILQCVNAGAEKIGGLEPTLTSELLKQFDEDLAALGFVMSQPGDVTVETDSPDYFAVPQSWTSILDYELNEFGRSCQ